jgi:hypothetical protein
VRRWKNRRLPRLLFHDDSHDLKWPAQVDFLLLRGPNRPFAKGDLTF